MTREEKKKACNKEYYIANKEKWKAHYAANKEKKKAYYIANKEKRKAYRSSRKHEPLVYLLPKCNWVGTTESITERIYNHKRVGRNVENYKILKRFDNRADALGFERKMHDLGYNGRHANNLYN